MIKEQTDTLSRWVLPDDASVADREEHAIPAAEIVDALRGGRAIEIANAFITGPFSLRSMVIPAEVQIRDTVIRDHADWSYATFKRVVSLVHSTFESRISLRAATMEQDLILERTTFSGQITATSLTVAGAFSAESSTFAKSPLFNQATFKQNARFDGVVFAEGALFAWAKFEAEANFSKARWKKLATFNGVTIHGRTFFQEATFEDKADFLQAQFGGSAYFNKATFLRAAEFSESRAENNVYFSEAVFGEAADFLRFRAGGSLEFGHVTFKRDAIFNTLQIDGSVFFEHATFEANLNLAASRIRGAVNLEHAVLHTADFSSTEIQGGAYFGDAVFEAEVRFPNLATTRAVFNNATFKGVATFYQAKCTDDALFVGTVFSQVVSFEGASFQSIQFSRPRTQFQGKVDLRGCTYARLEPIEYWRELMACLEPYDRQPFSHLEDLLRRGGNDRTARDVYYSRKRRESRRITLGTPLSWLLDRMLWLLTGYGVRLERLFIVTGLILFIATQAFKREGAVVPLDATPAKATVPATASTRTLSPRDAFWFSVKLFVPVDVPAAGEWRPAPAAEVWRLKMTTIATLLRLAGWILVPVGLAGVTGFLKR